ncbi:LuxE/PaaK family acyltransferase [Salegentibacter mishustinae]|uniref:Acyl transferase n=1 Tax=Salegentibacter mishustinae TaxID=270918 RepID=A0A0Q9ZGA6_9FLAO|nr:acyltransferase [Salegentibacter mishustinae]KRG27921.1 acyl transferase [Salegentibacter mishustinae]PNW20989.1 acyl transferase [Salegentibacter mishustinae]PZX63992.1 acyl-protein synthetase LuxE [Salegentibacter mishustinae]GGW89433.1 acyltransferase [Salegentibacter mishustinae]
MLAERIFNISTQKDFNEITLEVFSYQFQHNPVYREFCQLLKRNPKNVSRVEEIPFLPIEFFKKKKIISSEKTPEIIFTSSGTTGSATSKHYVTDLNVYEKSFLKAFEIFYGNPEEIVILALLPSYLERRGSSLIYMADSLIKRSKHPESGFYLDDLEALQHKLKELDKTGKKILLLGVSFALLNLVETYNFDLKNTTIMETGGMKGRRKEMIREELHQILTEGFGVNKIHSEYGMTELLSQSYSKGNGVFETPPWMKILIRDPEDALVYLPKHKTGGINVIDLANFNSCSFIATQDLARQINDDSTEILGRFDNSDIRGCNLLIL